MKTPPTQTESPPLHPVVDFFPPLDDAEYDALKADIQAHGQKVPIALMGGAGH
jgi:hypothetical protein